MVNGVFLLLCANALTLIVYDLPQELLATLSVKSQTASVAVQNTEPTPEKQAEGEAEHAIASTTSCPLCKVPYLNVQEQRDHARSDHHRYNVKAQLRGNPTLDEMQFAKAIGELDESISGSGSSESVEEEDASADVTLTALLKRQAKISQEAEEREAPSRPNPGKHPLFWFSSSLFPSNT